METQVSGIALLNDAFRKNSVAQYTVTTAALARVGLMDIVFAVRHFSEFNEDNDPYGEHDFGSLVLSSEKLFWKIDYYDQELQGWCDPLSPQCRRVLTVMLAEEY